MREKPYSKEYWRAVDSPRPKRRVIDRVVDALQFAIYYRRMNRIFDEEFKKLEKESKK